MTLETSPDRARIGHSSAAQAGAHPASEQMARLFRPSGVAVVGAGKDPASVGGRAVSALQGHGYSGEVYPINPNRDEIAGLPCYPSVLDIPGTIDVVEILVSPALTAQAVHDAGKKGATWAVLLNAGFSEIGPEGQALQAEVDAAAADVGVRLVGPNCGGLVNVIDDIRIGFMPAFDLGRLPPGPLGVAAQSGGVLTNALNKTFDRRIGVSYAASTGNEPDVTALDFAMFMLDDPVTRAVALYTENLEDAARFIELCERALDASKPIVLLKGGRSPAGQATAASHTGALATPQRVLESVASRYGVTLADDFDDWLDIGWFLASEDIDRAAPRRVVALATSGGTAVMTADALSDVDIELPPPSPETEQRLRDALPAFGISRNPIDITAQYINDPELFRRILHTLEDASEFDAILVSLAMVASSCTARFATDIVEYRQGAPIPVLTAWIGGSLTEDGTSILRDNGVPMFQRQSTAARALAAWRTFADGGTWRDGRRASTPHAGVKLELPDHADLTEYEALMVLTVAGIPFPPSVLTSTRQEAVDAAIAIGHPVALKLSARGVTHKSELGGVHLRLADAAAVGNAFDQVERIAATLDTPAQVLVQQMVYGVAECIVGLERDRQFGWVLLLGLGGVVAEVFGDTAIAPLPVDRDEVHRLLEGLQSFPLLDGFRGRPSADVNALVDIVLDLARAAVAMPDDVVSVEINPVIVRAKGQGAVAGDAVIVRNATQEVEQP